MSNKNLFDFNKSIFSPMKDQIINIEEAESNNKKYQHIYQSFEENQNYYIKQWNSTFLSITLVLNILTSVFLHIMEKKTLLIVGKQKFLRITKALSYIAITSILSILFYFMKRYNQRYFQLFSFLNHIFLDIPILLISGILRMFLYLYW